MQLKATAPSGDLRATGVLGFASAQRRLKLDEAAQILDFIKVETHAAAQEQAAALAHDRADSQRARQRRLDLVGLRNGDGPVFTHALRRAVGAGIGDQLVRLAVTIGVDRAQLQPAARRLEIDVALAHGFGGEGAQGEGPGMSDVNVGAAELLLDVALRLGKQGVHRTRIRVDAVSRARIPEGVEGWRWHARLEGFGPGVYRTGLSLVAPFGQAAGIPRPAEAKRLLMSKSQTLQGRSLIARAGVAEAPGPEGPAGSDASASSNGMPGAMPEQVGVEMEEATVAQEQPVATAAQPASTGLRHVLPFEKPLAQLEQQIAELERAQSTGHADHTAELRQLRENYTAVLRKTYENLSAWETVQVARHPQRPLFLDYVEMICREFREIHGDRRYGDDYAIRCGLAKIGGHKVMLVGHHKGRDTREKIKCMFGLANPEGYRKALRAMKLAEKFKLPVVTLIDTPGAYPGIGAEERGQAQSIATNLMEMARLGTPIVSVIIGEGGSGGALGIAVADRVAMSQYGWYSVISPEACSSILFKDPAEAPRMAEALKLTSRDLMRLGVIDAVVPEPLGGAHRDPAQAAHHLEQYLAKTLRELKRKKPSELAEQRYEKFRRMGEFSEPGQTARGAVRSAG